MIWGRIGALLGALLVASCVTVAPNSLSLDDVRAFRLAAVEVNAAPDANVVWAAGEIAYSQATGKAATSDPFTPTPEAAVFLRQEAARRLRAALEERLPAVMAGTRPVRVVTTIKFIDVPSEPRRILLGGANHLKADTVILDAKTGRELAAYRNGASYDMVGNGIAGVLVQAAIDSGRGIGGYDKLVRTYADDFVRWLTRA